MKPELVAKALIARSVENENGCLIWQGAKWKDGYGCIRIGKLVVAAHRAACELRHGPALVAEAMACHTCQTPACVNGDHLYWGDAATNARDREAQNGSVRPKKTHCRNGHLKDVPGRPCEICHRANARRWYRRNRVRT